MPLDDRIHLPQSETSTDCIARAAQPRVDYSWLERRPANITRVVFIRHGRSTFNDQQRFQGRSDRSVLTPEGHETAHQTGTALQGIPFDAIYSSPLQRTQQTARAIAMEMGGDLDISSCLQLLEVNLLSWEGKTYASVQAEWPELYSIWKNNPQKFSLPLVTQTTSQPPQRHSRHRFKQLFPLVELYRQAFDFWNFIRTRHCGDLLLAVAHGGSIRAAISTALGLPTQYYHQLQQSNCGISVVDVTWENTALLGWSHGINQTGHLGETLPKLKNGKTGLRVIAIPSDSDRVEKLRLWLTQVPIQHCWTDATPSSRALAKRLCPDMSPTICRTLEHWSATLHQAIPMQKIGLATAVVVASPKTLATLFTTGLKKTSWSSLGAASFTLNTATILHFPHRHHPPVLQSFSFIPPQNSVTQ